ncbi:uncharacterized protein MONBRDRAFT_26102 [Monosiga brevicollis MX1]|uniref:JmjC domain-containing protein n=1 Tax=Monosiga brevicollis TaxID=81824 RepID=A9V1D0_MONBE|nr:uncharacterized protein MONBRDRAFT_26102 [Monosiga brevicollis MX1]EDQ88419.1 predicted protein [Monosiga brevicollis MX1]|eukprot:XP_001746523.1 hypothetical protein [Monosiga brevicollis MX1]
MARVWYMGLCVLLLSGSGAVLGDAAGSKHVRWQRELEALRDGELNEQRAQQLVANLDQLHEYDPVMHLGAELEAQGFLAAALECYDHAVGLDQSRPEAVLAAAVVLAKQGLHVTAQEILDMVAPAPMSPALHTLLSHTRANLEATAADHARAQAAWAAANATTRRSDRLQLRPVDVLTRITDATYAAYYARQGVPFVLRSPAWNATASIQQTARYQSLQSVWEALVNTTTADVDMADAWPSFARGDVLAHVPMAQYSLHWPSLFLGDERARSALHVDAYCSHFFMTQLVGRKRWIIFPASDTFLLGRNYASAQFPLSWADVTIEGSELDMADDVLAAHPGLRLARPYQIILEPGDTLFVPGQSAHMVANLASPTMAVSGNYVDATNQACVEASLAHSGALHPEHARLRTHLIELQRI